MTDFRTGPWMQTACGGALPLIGVQARHIDWRDVARGLALTCRFAGQMRDCRVYSVAQHSVLVARALPVELRPWGLLHDASEAYLVDVPRPVKPFLAGYKEAEEAIERAVAEAFGLVWPMPAEVKRVDNAILADEAAQIMVSPPRGWCLIEPALGIDIDPWSPQTAKRKFLEAFHEIESK